MKNNTIKISTISVICALVASGAHAAAAVRSLGGVGTYSGTNAAAVAASNSSGTTTSGSTGSATRNVAGTARASAMRVTPSSNKSATSTNVSSSNTGSRAATTARVSAGQYFAGNKSTATSGGSSTRPGTSNATGYLEERVDALESDVKDLKEDMRTTQEDLAGLQDDLEKLGDLDSVVHVGDNVSDLKNDAKYVTESDLEDVLDDYVTNEELATELGKVNGTAGDIQQEIENLKKADEELKKADAALEENKANKSDVYSKSDIDSMLDDIDGAVDNRVVAPDGVRPGYYMLGVTSEDMNWQLVEVIGEDGNVLIVE